MRVGVDKGDDFVELERGPVVADLHPSERFGEQWMVRVGGSPRGGFPVSLIGVFECAFIGGLISWREFLCQRWHRDQKERYEAAQESRYYL